MSVRELALRDGAVIFGKRNATPFVLADGDGAEFPVSGIIDDIGLSTDADGVQVAGRTAEASYRSASVSKGGRVATPSEGWTLSLADGRGLVRRYAVTYAAPDAMLGITRLRLSADLSAGGESAPGGEEDDE